MGRFVSGLMTVAVVVVGVAGSVCLFQEEEEDEYKEEEDDDASDVPNCITLQQESHRNTFVAHINAIRQGNILERILLSFRASCHAWARASLRGCQKAELNEALLSQSNSSNNKKVVCALLGKSKIDHHGRYQILRGFGGVPKK